MSDVGISIKGARDMADHCGLEVGDPTEKVVTGWS